MPPISVQDALTLAGSSIQRAASMLWELDENRLRPNVDYTLDLQQVANDSRAGSVAPHPLFRHLSPDVWKRKTFGAFKTLLNRYDPRAISIDTIEDEAEFISAIIETPCVRFVREWLVANGHAVSQSMEDFACLLMGMWFTEHSPGKGRKSGAAQRTGFQHVFCGEINSRSQLSGLHNFVRVYLEERQGNLRYMGYMKPRYNCPDSPLDLAKQHMLKIRFGLHGHEKRISSMFFGVSPEFEVGLYSLVIIAGVSEIVTNLGVQTARVRAVSKKGKVLTAYPQLLERGPSDLTKRNFAQHPTASASTVLGKRKRREASSEIKSVRPQRRQRTRCEVVSVETVIDVDALEGNSCDEQDVEVMDLAPDRTTRCRTEGAQVNLQLSSVPVDVIDLTIDEARQVTTSLGTTEVITDLTADN